jgi:hypothetical protein
MTAAAGTLSKSTISVSIRPTWLDFAVKASAPVREPVPKKA